MAASLANVDAHAAGCEMHALATALYPICRSITGNGFRESLRILSGVVPIEMHEVPTGTQVFDWTVPKEWNIRDAWVKNEAGERVIDFQQNNLHVVNYSVPVNERMPFEALDAHLHSLPDQPDLIPYRTSYYKETWGFCLSHNQRQSLKPGMYEVVIGATLEPGHLTYGEIVVPGETDNEVFFSCHACHPSLANDNLSGMTLVAQLAKHLREQKPLYTYRFLLAPGTIGAITWLSRNEAVTGRIKHGLVVANVGDKGIMHYKKSRRGSAEIDRVAQYVLQQKDAPFEVLEFTPYGYDERQYCSPGFNLPVGSLTRTPWGQYPEYHTSGDNLDFISAESLADSFTTYAQVIEILEHNHRYENLSPKCEPQLGKRGLYRAIGGASGDRSPEMAMLWTLNLSDGGHTLLDIAQRSTLPFHYIKDAAHALEQAGLLAVCPQA